MTEVTPLGEIPQSTVLAEAKVDSLTELLSRDPLGFQAVDRKQIVAQLRVMREKWEATEGKVARPKAAKASTSTLSPKDLGL